MEYPDYFARFYDVIYQQLRQSVDATYYLSKIMQAKGPVMEVGSGTGRLFTKALSKGADIFGIDVSQSMLDVLKSRIEPEQHHRISKQSMVDFNQPYKFNLIVAPFRVFMHLLSVNEQLKALNNISQHLTDDGIFIFDLFIPNLTMLMNGLDNAVDFEGEYEPGKTLKRITSMHADTIEQLSNIKMRFEWQEEKNVQEATWNAKMRYFFRYELEHLIGRSKLELLKIAGDYHEKELKSSSRDFIVICSRRCNSSNIL